MQQTRLKVDLEETVNTLTDDREAFQKHLNALQEEIKDLQSMNARLTSKVSEKADEVDVLTEQRATLEHKLEETVSQFTAGEKEMARELLTAQTQYRDLQLTVDKQLITLASKEREISRLKEEKVRWTDFIDRSPPGCLFSRQI